MLSYSVLFWLAVAAILVTFWWQSDKIKRAALVHVIRYCKNHSLQLLDQTMMLKGVWASRDEIGSLKIRRRYVFEFSSTGQARYQGEIVLLGHILKSMELEAHILPEDEDRFS